MKTRQCWASTSPADCSSRPTDGTNRTELYRVRRVKEIAGRKRFIELEVELERVKTTAGDTDAEREALFAEGATAPPMVN